MSLLNVSGARHVISPGHRKIHLRGDRTEIVVLALRLVAVALLGAVGWMHVHLWQNGYRHIPTIGPLFVAAAVSALVVGAGLLVRPSRLIGISAFGVVLGAL